MRSKTILAFFAAAVIACGLLVQQSQAVQITGNITFAGGVELNSSNADLATAVLAWHGIAAGDKPQVQSRDGGFAGFVTAGDGVTFAAPWNFNSGAVPNFWSVDGFTFNLTASSVTPDLDANSVTVDGTGSVSGNGFMATPGSFHFTTQNPAAGSPAVFSFSAASGFVAQVPDGGSSVALLGIALAGVEAVRRKIRARKS